MLTLILFAFALSSDAFAVAMARGAVSQHRWHQAITTAVVFSIFEGGMTAGGWSLGLLFHEAFDTWGRYVVASLLVLLGLKMFLDARRNTKNQDAPDKSPDPVGALLGLLGAGLAISLDAAACGAALPFMSVTLFISIVVISLMTFVLSLAGHRIGGMAGQKLGSVAEQAGGLILILLSVKVLFI